MMAINNLNQLPLFPEMLINIEQTGKDINYSKSVISKLHSIRRDLPDTEGKLIAKINKALEDIRAISRITPTQLEELILIAIEKHQAWTLADICDDLELDRKTIQPVVIEMQKKGLVRFVKRVIPGSFKPNFLIKSNRIKQPDAV